MRYRIKKETRKAMNRSGNIQCDICEEHEILCDHHINGRDIPNANHTSNIAHLCSNCHRKVHEGLIAIEG